MRVHLGKYKRDGSTRKQMVHIDYWDVWSADHTLALIIHPMLIRLKDVQHGHPCVGDPIDFEPPFPLPCDTCKCVDEWHAILDKMIWSFAQLIDETAEDKFYSGEIENIRVPVNYDDEVVAEEHAELIRYEKGPNDTFEIDLEGLREHQQKIQEGLDLFGKHYQSLWD